VVRGSVLAVDDEEDVLELVRYNFHKEGFKVDTAATGEDALKKARANLPNVILLDIMLPGINGIGTSRADNRPRHKHRRGRHLYG